MTAFTAGMFAAALEGKYGEEAKAIAEELKRMYKVASDLRVQATP